MNREAPEFDEDIAPEILDITRSMRVDEDEQRQRHLEWIDSVLAPLDQLIEPTGRIATPGHDVRESLHNGGTATSETEQLAPRGTGQNATLADGKIATSPVFQNQLQGRGFSGFDDLGAGICPVARPHTSLFTPLPRPSSSPESRMLCTPDSSTARTHSTTTLSMPGSREVDAAESSAGTPPTPASTSRPSSSRSRSCRRSAAPAEPRVRPVAWKRLSDDEKLLRSFLTAEKHNGWAFTLRLSRQVRSSLGPFSLRPTRLMAHRLNRELKKAFGEPLPYSFVFEEYLDTDLHVHGVIIPNSPADRKKLIKALQKAGGVFEGRAASRQVKLNALGAAGGYERDAGGYLAYANLKKTRRWLGPQDITHIGGELRRMAEADHENARLSRG